MKKDELKLSVADSELDQEAMALQEIAAGDLDAWEQLALKLMGKDRRAFTESEMLLILRLAGFSGWLITGRLLGRNV